MKHWRWLRHSGSSRYGFIRVSFMVSQHEVNGTALSFTKIAYLGTVIWKLASLDLNSAQCACTRAKSRILTKRNRKTSLRISLTNNICVLWKGCSVLRECSECKYSKCKCGKCKHQKPTTSQHHRLRLKIFRINSWWTQWMFRSWYYANRALSRHCPAW